VTNEPQTVTKGAGGIQMDRDLGRKIIVAPNNAIFKGINENHLARTLKALSLPYP